MAKVCTGCGKKMEFFHMQFWFQCKNCFDGDSNRSYLRESLGDRTSVRRALKRLWLWLFERDRYERWWCGNCAKTLDPTQTCDRCGQKFDRELFR